MKKVFNLFASILLLVGSMSPMFLYALTVGPKNGATFSNASFSGSDHSWSNVGNAETSNNSRATVSISNTSNVSDYLKARNFSFNIPDGATIDGIEVDIERYRSNDGHIRDNVVRLLKNDTVVGDNKAKSDNWPNGSSSEAYTSYGGATDKWGTTWTVADINNSNFGVVLSVLKNSNNGESSRANVDHIRITVHYTEQVVGPSPKNGGTFSNTDFSGSDHSWSNVGNAETSNNSRATVSISSTSNISDYLKARNFGFNIPAGSTIDGIKVDIERHRSNNAHIRDNIVRLLKNDSVVGDNKAKSDNWPDGSSNEAYTSYGGATDKWGTTWTANDINSSNFGVVLSVLKNSNNGDSSRANVDHIRITVYYTEPVEITSNPTLSESCGLDIALVADISSSVDSSELVQLKSALTTFASAFIGTQTTFSLSQFGTVGTVLNAFPMSPAQTVTAIAAVSQGGTQYTNWDDGLAKAYSTFLSNDTPNLLIIATDGDPNRYGNPAQGNGTEFNQASLDAAISRANTIKGNGTRILTVGIGNDFTADHLKSISGPNVNAGGVNVDLITTQFNTLANALVALSEELCGGTITVNKFLGSVDTPAGTGWTFNIAGSTKSTNENGITPSVEVDPGSYSVTETSLVTGYTFTSAACFNQDDQQVGTAGEMGVTGIVVGASDIIVCNFVNTLSTCGDGYIQGEEICDEGELNGTPNNCNETCTGITDAVCGNGMVEEGETCDAGELNGTPNNCSETCTGTTAPVCGNGAIEEGEVCDAGELNGTPNNCSETCTGTTAPVCGNAVIEEGESCDEGELNGTPAHCNLSCSGITSAMCGNGTIEEGEACDDGNGEGGENSDSEPNACRTDCSLPTCGDGVMDAEEVCDDGDANGMPNHCNLSCTGTTDAVCGNGAVEEGEECDEGDLNGTANHCNEICTGTTSPVCGNNVVEEGEVCDSGIQNGKPNHCNDSCDGIVKKEKADNGNTSSPSTSSSSSNNSNSNPTPNNGNLPSSVDEDESDDDNSNDEENVDTDNNEDESNVEETANEENSEDVVGEETDSDTNTDDSSESTSDTSSVEEISEQTAYEYAFENSLTEEESFEEALPYEPLLRKEAARMIIDYVDSLGGYEFVHSEDMCSFGDISDLSLAEQDYIVTACRLGLMGLRADGSPASIFHPNNTLTRAEFGTLTSRMLRGNAFNSIDPDSVDWYVAHLEALKEAGIMNHIDSPFDIELRIYAWIIFQRIYQLYFM